MKKLLEDILFTGLGSLVVTKEKAQELVDKMIKQGEVSKKEGKEVMDKFLQKTEASREKIQSRISQEVEDRLDQVGFVTKNEFEELRLQVNRLEQELKELKEEIQENNKEDNNQ